MRIRCFPFRPSKTDHLIELVLGLYDRFDNFQRTIMSAIEDLRADVAAQKSVNQSAVVLIQGLGQKLADACARLQAIADNLKASTTPLSDAIMANTPAAPAPAPEPAPFTPSGNVPAGV